MAHARKKPAATKTEESPAPEDTIAPAESPDAIDTLIAEGQVPPLASTPSQNPPEAGFASRITRPDPFDEITIALSNSNDAPKMRLYRSKTFQQMAMQFDEKPDEAVRLRLREEGWTWRTADGVWTRQFGERPGETHRKAQELFESIASDIRQANGLEPVTFKSQSR
jgi:hypothetical protein